MKSAASAKRQADQERLPEHGPAHGRPATKGDRAMPPKPTGARATPWLPFPHNTIASATFGHAGGVSITNHANPAAAASPISNDSK